MSEETDKQAYEYLNRTSNTIIRIMQMRKDRTQDPTPSDLTHAMYNHNDSEKLIGLIEAAARYMCKETS